jgi:MSHA biogenesis protein MshK
MSRHAAMLLLAATLGGTAAAQSLEDPTRPPPMLAPAVTGKDAAAAVADSAPRLQSVLIGRGPHARHVAVIDGQTVRLGEKFRGAQLVRVSETEVELAAGKHRQILKLFPASAPDAATP